MQYMKGQRQGHSPEAHGSVRTLARFTAILFSAALFALGVVTSAHAKQIQTATALPWKADYLLFCNKPERLNAVGTYADARLLAGKTYRIFWHYRNTTVKARPLVVSFIRGDQTPFSLDVRKGVALPQTDPSWAGSQAMSRYLNAPARRFVANRGTARFPVDLQRWQVGSGVMTVRPDRDVRLRIYFGADGTTVPGMQVVAVPAPRREITVSLSATSPQYYARIGQRELGMAREMDGTYGLFYHFRVAAPPGRKVRVTFSPRGGKAGLVGTLAGRTRQSPIVEATRWAIFGEAMIGKEALFLRTAPFGGVFYPVELAFHLM